MRAPRSRRLNSKFPWVVRTVTRVVSAACARVAVIPAGTGATLALNPRRVLLLAVSTKIAWQLKLPRIVGAPAIWMLPVAFPLVMALVAVLTLVSVGLYLGEWVRHMNSAETGAR